MSETTEFIEKVKAETEGLTKKCVVCNKEKSYDEFQISSIYYGSNHVPYCNDCGYEKYLEKPYERK